MSLELQLGANVQPAVDALKTVSTSLKSMGEEVKRTDQTWQQFVGQRMGSYMQQFGSHGAAIKQIAEEWKAYKGNIEQAVPANEHIKASFAGETGIIQQLRAQLAGLKTSLQNATDPADIAKFSSAIVNTKNQLHDALAGSNAFATSTFGVSRATRLAHADLENVSQSIRGFATGSERGVDALSNIVFSFERLRGVSGGTGAAMRALGETLLGPAGIVLAITTLLPLAQVFIDKLFGLSEAQKKAAEDAKKLAEAHKAIIDSTAKEATQVTELVAVLQNNTESHERQLAAKKKLIEIAPEYFGNLDKEGTSLKTITGDYDKYIANLDRAIETKLRESELEKLIADRIEKTNKLQLLAPIIPAGKFGTPGLSEDQKKLQSELEITNQRIERLHKTIDENHQVKIDINTSGADDVRRKIISQAKEIQSSFPALVIPTDKIFDFESIQTQFEKAKKIIADFQRGFGTSQELRIKIIPEIAADFDKAKFNIEPEIDLPKAKINILSPDFNLIGSAKTLQDTFNKIQAPEQIAKEFKKINDELQKATTFDEKLKALVGLKTLSEQTGVVVKGLEGISQQAANTAVILESGLTAAFNDFFDAVLKGQNPIKAFFNSIIKSIDEVIKKFVAAKIQSAIIGALTSGSGSVGGRASASPISAGAAIPQFIPFAGQVAGRTAQTAAETAASASLAGLTTAAGVSSAALTALGGISTGLATSAGAAAISQTAMSTAAGVATGSLIALTAATIAATAAEGAASAAKIVAGLSFLGGFAEGGEPPVGQVSIVGERGPELFVPKVAGTIIPNHQIQNFSSLITKSSFSEVASTIKNNAIQNFIQSLPQLKTGGLTSSDTVAQLHKAEVIMPLDRLQGLIGKQNFDSGPQEITFNTVLRGEDIWLSGERYTKRKGRSY